MSSRNPDGEWKSALDSKSGRTYYYHTKTKATTWTKPLELAGPEERKVMLELKEKTLQFFREMEANIRAKIEKARQIDEENLKRRANSHSEGEEEEGFYCLDEGGNSFELNDDREVRTRTGVPFASANSAFTSSQSHGQLESLSRPRPSLAGRASSGSVDYTGVDYGAYDPKMANRTRKNSSSGLGMGPPRRIRTISTMDDEILLTMRRNSTNGGVVDGGKRTGAAGTSTGGRPSNAHRDPFLSAIAEEKDKFGGPTNLMRDTSKEISDRVADRYPVAPPSVSAKTLVENMVTDPSAGTKSRRAAPHLRRRNSTGTIFLSHTMSNQDNAATIECVCVVIRAHMLDAAKENVVPLPEYDVFKDAAFQQPQRSRSSTLVGSPHSSAASAEAMVPSLITVKDFFMYVFSKSQLESDTIIMALIYCERLVKETKGRLCIRYDNWRSILFACLVMASKVWDDLSMWNVDFSQVYPSFDLHRVNTLELAMLEALKYVIRVSASEYAKYYFHLRSMMARLRLNNQSGDLQLKPLDIASARNLQLSTQKDLEQRGANAESSRRRFYSVHETGGSAVGTPGSAHSGGSSSKGGVMLEQLVQSEHLDADGQVHLSKKGGSFKQADRKSPAKKSNPLSPLKEDK